MDASSIHVLQSIIIKFTSIHDGDPNLADFNKNYIIEENDFETEDSHKSNGICPYKLLTYVCEYHSQPKNVYAIRKQSTKTIVKIIICLSGSLISIPCILATVLVYIFIPELRNLHGTCLICYLMFMALSIIFTNPYVALNVAFRIAGCYLGLCAIHWLQVISFDMWWNFKSLQ